MPRQNRVSPSGRIEASDARGTLMGNRGILHDALGRLGTARWRHPHWIACRLAFKDRHREVMTPGRWTELFFLDEATALAAGHRPCAECRRDDYRRLAAAWVTALGGPASAPAIDRALHAARIEPGTRHQRTWRASIGSLPLGSFVALPERPDEAWLKLKDRLRRWSHHGYDATLAVVPAHEAIVLTPHPLVAVLAAGYVPALHPTADEDGRPPPSMV